MGVEPNSSDPTLVPFVYYDNCRYPSPPTRTSAQLDPKETWGTLHQKIVDKLKYPIEMTIFSLASGKEIPDPNKTPEETHKDKKIVVHLHRVQGAKDPDFGILDRTTEVRMPPEPTNTTPESSPPHSTAIVPYEDKMAGASAGAGVGVGSSNRATSSYSYGYNSSADWNAKSTTGFVGLSNQGATCYMNSLIQTLFMTPEFRYALYKWDFDDFYKKSLAAEQEEASSKEKMDVEKDNTNAEENEEAKRAEKEKKSIPRQLQLLFARLQLRDTKAVKTKDLTNSFGWRDSDAFVQHDVQELCRVLFDALEKVLRGTPSETLINDLYQGEMQDYVKCKECQYESARTDKYLDIPLVIRGYDSKVLTRSIEEGIENFVTAEVLDGDNQFKCEKCDKRVDALKGLKFSSFPYLLSLQLKRFHFDLEMFRRVKLNDKVTFPFILDLNKYSKEENKDDMAVDQKRTDDEFYDKKEETELELAQRLLKNGPNVYELYSVLIHRGSALGGHYYAYIKSFASGKWFEFNDSQVSEISKSDIYKTFGEDDDSKYSKGGMFSMFQSSANAYMLMYRRIDPERNMQEVTLESIPSELKKTVLEENDSVKKKTRRKRKRKRYD
eukprot:TRINITY_DN2517_c0_g1_i1.p1 TRINITY_DN2517_c0_g1~~TRINITY_DN2517_c0_g1_i1.p1  ORF type:complete len:610 (+),score=142.53 TRINITY_DN2517_c0_g1_i1:98-1927(+)